MIKNFNYLFVVVLAFSSVACSPKKIASDMTAKIMTSGAPKMEQESEIDIAQNTSLTLIKMLETFQYDNPTNAQTNTLLARSYVNYAQGFLELDLLRAKHSHSVQYDKIFQRTRMFYERAKGYGLQALSQKGSLKKTLTGNMEEFEKAVKGIGASGVPDMFWAAMAWGSWINYNKDSPQALADFPRVEALMNRVLQLQETYFYGTPHIFLGYSFASRPAMFGGNLDKSKEHFEIALAITERKFLMAQVFYAELYATMAQDQGLFESLLNEVLSADPAALPEARLANELAKLRARELLANEKVYFGKVNKV